MSVDKSKTLTLRTGDAAFYQYDPLLGFWGIPHMERDVCFSGVTDVVTHVRHNNEGNRDKDFTKGKQDGAILCLGGSHTWGVGVDQENRYTEHLEKMIQQPVLNLGHCSLGLDQVCLVILNKAEIYRPSVIIIEQYPWAIHRVLNTFVNGFTRPYFYLNENGDLKLQKMSKLTVFPVCRKMMGAFYTYRKELKEFKAGIDLKDSYDPWTDPIFLYWKANYYDYMYEIVDKIVAVIQDFCRQKGIKLLFGLEPIMQQYGERSRSSLVDYNLPQTRLKAILEKNRIATVDMMEPMVAEHTTETPVIFNDGHMNEKGHGIFAQELSKYMDAMKWFAK